MKRPPATDVEGDSPSPRLPRREQDRRGRFTATILPSGRVLAVGGTDGTGLPLASAESYSP
jgi:hypothetical protein